MSTVQSMAEQNMTVAQVASEVVRLTGWTDHDAQRWTIENAIGADMIPTGSGAAAEITGEDAIILLHVAENTDESGVYVDPTPTAAPTDPRAALIEHMAKRIRWAMHTGDYANATVVAEEFAERFERVIADATS